MTQLIEDKNEFIIDRYGRYGRLVNIGNYYFFQPLELNNPIIPLRDRQRPVDFKREKIIFAPQKKQESVEEIRKKYEARMKESERVRLLSGVMKEQSEELGGLEKIVETREGEKREKREKREKCKRK